jgi:hypothetical protein
MVLPRKMRTEFLEEAAMAAITFNRGRTLQRTGAAMVELKIITMVASMGALVFSAASTSGK